ncbi:predicted protein [Naegleria gruberi]|uniref:Predicted protein n=1 Tax=Naegleria gruberi TaxID=5762 RepID=D2W5T4_NAEGR|nr:uncharacterized protein NAEGRDRAFT_76777 [Naegleria gruberi]EFC35567.1 predicted protein [Naegleria gruberi]|eukprot:XP_002668311.1 predicted protein [Naegleria gruberi strain NEG-M]
MQSDSIKKLSKKLYKASRDGFQSKQFHTKCDNQGATVTIIKADTGAIFGGYTSAAWNTTVMSQFAYSERAFLFSLVSNSGEERFKKLNQLAPPNSPSQGRSIYSHSRFGPTFGGGHDLYICSNAHENTGSYCHPNTYADFGKEYLAGSYKEWLVKDIEVYSL